MKYICGSFKNVSQQQSSLKPQTKFLVNLNLSETFGIIDQKNLPEHQDRTFAGSKGNWSFVLVHGLKSIFTII